MPELNIYFAGLLVFIGLVMGGLATRTAIQVFRLRNKRMSWRAGTLKGFPLFSTIFLFISFGLSALMWMNGGFWDLVASWLYLFTSVSWFITSYFSSKRYITDNGLVKNVNDPSQTVAWHQIRDFFDSDESSGHTYTFIYSDHTDEAKLHRLELVIPSNYEGAFKKLISHKLGRRISCYDHTLIESEKF